MDNSAQTKKTFKYLGIEGGIVLIVIAAIVIFFLKPFSGVNFFFLKQKAPSAMLTTKPVNSTKSAVVHFNMTQPPQISTIILSDKGFNPTQASASAKGTVIRIVNNTIQPVTLEFSGNLAPAAVLAPNGSWDSPTIVTRGNFKYTVKGTSISGTIVFK